MSSSELSAPDSPGRRRKTDDADSIEGLVAPPPRRKGPKGARRRRKPGKEEKPSGATGSRTLRVLLGALSLAVVALVAVLVVQFVMGGSGSAPADSRPVAYQVVNTDSGLSETLESREVDNRALSEGEVLERGNEEIESQGITFELAATAFTDACEDVVWGEEVQQALAEAGCTQAAVGGYTSGDYVGLAAIFNLEDVDGSVAVAGAMEPPEAPEAEASGFVNVPSEDAPFDALGAGYSAAEAAVSGHYLVVTWTQSVDSTAADERESLSAPLIALSNFRDPLFRRVVQLENATQPEGGAGGGGGAGTGGEEEAGAGEAVPEAGEADPGAAQPEGGAEPEVPVEPGG